MAWQHSLPLLVNAQIAYHNSRAFDRAPYVNATLWELHGLLALQLQRQQYTQARVARHEGGGGGCAHFAVPRECRVREERAHVGEARQIGFFQPGERGSERKIQMRQK